MNDLNPILEAMGEIDERTVAEAVKKPKLKKPLKIVLIAAAAATLALLAGFTTSAVGRHRFGFYQEKSASRAFDLKLAPHEIDVPEEFMPQDGHFGESLDTHTPPSELFELFGLTLPINDKFTEINGEKTTVDVSIIDENIEIEFDYTLYNKTIGSEVYFRTRYFSKTDNMDYQSCQGLLPGEPSEIITLNDGSLCMVTSSMAVFSLDGAHCQLELPYDYEIPENVGQLPIKEQYRIVAEMIEAMPGIDTVKQVLSDLGVLEK